MPKISDLVQRWKVIGGAERGGIIVRSEQDLASDKLDERLATGSVVEELQIADERLRYRLLEGNGPKTGWVSTHLTTGKELLEPLDGSAQTRPHAAAGGSIPDAALGAALQAAEAASLAGRQPDNITNLEVSVLKFLQTMRKAYADKSFQAEVKKAHDLAEGNHNKLLFTLGMAASRVQDPVFKKFGLPEGGKGVFLMKAGTKAVSAGSPKIQKLAGDLRELLGLEREEVLQPLFQGEEDSWKAKASKYRGTCRERAEELRRLRHLSAPFSVSQDGGALDAATDNDWRPAGIATFFPGPDVEVTAKTPMGRPLDPFDSDPKVDRTFGSPEMMAADRYEMNTWMSRMLAKYSGGLGDLTSSRLFEDAGPPGEAGAQHRLKAIYVAGVEGTGHHGFNPMLTFPAVCQYGEGTLNWWRSLREVFMKTPPRRRRARLREVLEAACVGSRPHILLESASWPFGEEGRERWAPGCDDPSALRREELSGNPGNSFELGEFVELLGEVADVKVLVLHRALHAAAWSHKEWDEGLVEHAKILALFAEYLTKTLSGMPRDAWRWVAYEDVCQAHNAGDFSALDPLADFLELSREDLRRSFRCFRPSRKDAAAEMSPAALAAIRDVEKRHAGGWFPTLFPSQRLLVGADGVPPALSASPDSSQGEEAAAFNQKMALLMESLDPKQRGLWREAHAAGLSEVEQTRRMEKLRRTLTEDQEFLIGKAMLTERMVEATQRNSVDPSRFTCVHMWIEYRGIGSEINNLLSAAVFCEENGLDCVVEDELWNAGRLHDYLQAEPVIYRRCPRGDRCTQLEVKRDKQVATPGWFAICKHAMGVPFGLKAECARRLWRLTDEAAAATAKLNSSLRLPTHYLAMHVRRGDKIFQPDGKRGGESLPIAMAAYVDKALELFRPPCEAIVVCSDDATFGADFARVLERKRTGTPVRWRAERPAPEALRKGHWQKAWNDLPLKERRDLTHEFLADVEVMRDAHVLICTHSSNVGRLVAQLRDGNTHSLDEAWTNS